MVKKNMKGGNSSLPLTPGEYKGVGTIAVAGDANFAEKPNTFPSKQVGGRSRRSKKQCGGRSYGFANTADVPSFAGSYVPVTPMCTAKVDVSRGGNNFMSGGKGRSKTQRGGLVLIGGKSKKRGKGGAILIGGGKSNKRSKSSRGKGGAILIGGGKSKRSKSNKRSKSKRSKSTNGKKTQKWWQVGCKKLVGGFIGPI